MEEKALFTEVSFLCISLVASRFRCVFWRGQRMHVHIRGSTYAYMDQRVIFCYVWAQEEQAGLLQMLQVLPEQKPVHTLVLPCACPWCVIYRSRRVYRGSSATRAGATAATLCPCLAVPLNPPISASLQECQRGSDGCGGTGQDRGRRRGGDPRITPAPCERRGSMATGHPQCHAVSR